MKAVLLAFVILLTGCVTQIEPTVTDRYSDVPELKRIETAVVVLPTTPELKVAVVEGQTVAVLDLEGVNTLQEFRTIARKNTEALQQSVDLYNTAVERDRILLSSLRLEEGRANAKERMYVDAENARRNQAAESRVESLIQKAVIILMGFAWVL